MDRKQAAALKRQVLAALDRGNIQTAIRLLADLLPDEAEEKPAPKPQAEPENPEPQQEEKKPEDQGEKPQDQE